MDIRCALPTRLPGYAYDKKSNSLNGTLAPLFIARTNVIFQGANVSWVSSESRSGCLNDSCFGGPRLLQLDQADIYFSIQDFQLLDSVQPNISFTVPLVEATCIFLTHYQSNLKLIQLDCLTNIQIINPWLLIPLIILLVALVWLANIIGLIKLSFHSSPSSLALWFAINFFNAFYRLITFMFNNQYPNASRTSQRLLIGFIVTILFTLKINYSADFKTDLTMTDKQQPVHNLQDILNYNLTGIISEASSCYKSLKQLSSDNRNQFRPKFIEMKSFLEFPQILDNLTDFTYLGPDWELDKVKADLIFHRESESSCSKFTHPDAYEHTASFDKSHGVMLVNGNSPAKSFIFRRIYIALESQLYPETYKRMVPSKTERYRRKCRQDTRNYSQFVFNPMVRRNYHQLFVIIVNVQFIGIIIFSIELLVSSNRTLRWSRIFSNPV